MKILPFHKRPRSIGAQIDRMKIWPTFKIDRSLGKSIVWIGQLRPRQKICTIGVYWGLDSLFDRPYVFLLDPPLMSRNSGEYRQIPHLMFNPDCPRMSGFCLFDPDGREWDNTMLIADTTIPWAAKWLRYYELWHYDGIWRGGGIGPESISQTREEIIHRSSQEYSSDDEKEAPLAIRQAIQNIIT